MKSNTPSTKTLQAQIRALQTRIKKLEEAEEKRNKRDISPTYIPNLKPEDPEGKSIFDYMKKLKEYIVPNEPIEPKYPNYRDTIICPQCREDTGIGRVLHMVIPPIGLRCPHCGAVVVRGNQIYCVT